jgi:hypothetical protein
MYTGVGALGHSFNGVAGGPHDMGDHEDAPPTPLLTSHPWTPLHRVGGGGDAAPVSLLPATFTGVAGSAGAQPWDVEPTAIGAVQTKRQGATILVSRW